MFQDPQWMPETTDSTKPACVVFSYMHIPFHLKDSLYDFLLVYLDCQHHYISALGPL